MGRRPADGVFPLVVELALGAELVQDLDAVNPLQLLIAAVPEGVGVEVLEVGEDLDVEALLANARLDVEVAVQLAREVLDVVGADGLAIVCCFTLPCSMKIGGGAGPPRPPAGRPGRM